MNIGNQYNAYSVIQKINIKEIKLRYKVTTVLYLVYATFMIYVYVHTDAMVPDEQWFLNIVNDITLDRIDKIFSMPNYLGYGSIYWLILKILDNFLAMRLLSLLAIFLVPVSIVYIMKNVLNKDIDEINCALLLYLSSPLAWFTGKIIGPELIGNIIGIVGAIVMIKSKQIKRNKTRNFLIGSIIVGIATGIKLYYVTYAIFSFIYILWDYKDNLRESIKKIVTDIFTLGIGVAIGLVIANPVLLTDFDTFRNNFASTSGYSITYLPNIFFRNYIEADLVNSGGLTKMVISLFGIIGVFISGLLLNRRLFCAGMCSFLFLTLACCKERFLGWYLLPLVFILPICFCKIRFRYFIIMLNLIIMFSSVLYQITFKSEQISNVRNELPIANEVKKWEDIYFGYKPYYFIEPCMQYIPFSIAYAYKFGEDEEELIFVSKHARNNVDVETIVCKAKEEVEGYRIVGFIENGGIAVIVKDEGEDMMSKDINKKIWAFIRGGVYQ